MKKGFIFILLTAFAFSTMEIVGKTISTQLNPFQLTFIRFFIGGLILLPFAIKEIKKRKLSLGIKDIGYFALTGTAGILVSMSFFQLAVLYTKASTVAVIFSTNSVFVIPLAWFILKEKLEKKMLIALFASILGILLIFNPFRMNPDIKGIVFSIIAAVTFALFGIIVKTGIPKYGGLVINSISFLIGDGLLLICLLFFKIPIISGIQGSNILQLLYLGIFVTGIGYLCYFEAMKRTSAITASIVFFIKPALAPILSLIILSEKITLNTVAGIICIVSASLVVFLRTVKT